MKRLLPILLMLVLVACEKSDDRSDNVTPDNPNVAACKMTDIVSTQIIAGTTYEHSQKSLFDIEGRLISIEIRYAGALARQEVLVYDSEGRISGKNSYTPSGRLEQTVRFEYDANDLLIKENITDFNQSGSQHISSITYEYTSPTQLKRKIQHYGGDLYSYATFEYTNGLMTKVSYDYNNGHLRSVTELEYDEKKHPMPHLTHPSNRLEATGFPFQHNIKKRTVTDLNSGETHTLTSTLTYNEEGYPISDTQIFSVDGSTYTHTYTYDCI